MTFVNSGTGSTMLLCKKNHFGSKVILKMTQAEMGEESGVQSNIVSACIGILKRAGVVKTVARGCYEVHVHQNADMAPIDYKQLAKKRQEKIDRLNEMLNFVNDDHQCRFHHILGYFGDSMKHGCGKCGLLPASGWSHVMWWIVDLIFVAAIVAAFILAGAWAAFWIFIVPLLFFAIINFSLDAYLQRRKKIKKSKDEEGTTHGVEIH